MSEGLKRQIFEDMHKGRNLSRHRLRGTYLYSPIAALWNQHIKTWEAAISTQVSDGWQSVPIEPTGKMMVAGVMAMTLYCPSWKCEDGGQSFYPFACYKAMLEASKDKP